MTWRLGNWSTVLLLAVQFFLVQAQANAQQCARASTPNDVSTGDFVNPVTPLFANPPVGVDTVTIGLCRLLWETRTSRRFSVKLAGVPSAVSTGMIGSIGWRKWSVTG